MLEELQIKALAELDGWTFSDVSSWQEKWTDENNVHHESAKPYLISYNAIIPLIQKQPIEIKEMVHRLYFDRLETGSHRLDVTPSQLAEALLRATGKWIE